jgi:putative ABC transport system permease protein
MRYLEGILIAFQAIRVNKLRTALTLIGIVIGVATVITVVSVINGMNNYVSEKINSMGPATFVVDRLGLITSREQFLERMKRKELTLEDVDAVKRYCMLCKEVGATTFTMGAVKYKAKYMEDVTIVGATDNYVDVSDIDIAYGRSFVEDDNQHRAAVCLLGPDVVDNVFNGEDPIDKMIKVGKTYFRVVGIGNRRGSFLLQNQDNWVAIPIRTFEKCFGSSQDLSIDVMANSVSVLEEAKDQVRVILRNRRGDRYKDPDSFDIFTAESIMQLYNNYTSTAWIVLIGVASISLVVGGIVVMNIMLVSVTERTREIGIRKAMGARNRDILWQFLLEAVTLAAFGGAVGVSLGCGLAWLVGIYSPLPASIETWAVLSGLTIATTVGLFFGIVPAMRAAKLDPIECLRFE